MKCLANAGIVVALAALPVGAAPVDEARFVKIGGIEQWITIKGDDARNPVVLKLGNNGQTRAPGIHIGAYREADAIPLQIRWDLRAIAETRAAARVQ